MTQQAESPVVDTPAAEPAPIDRHAAAMAAMEAAEAPSEPAVAPVLDEPKEAPKVETKPEPEAKPEEQLSPQMAALARREKRLREQEAKSKLEYEARSKELAEKQAAIGSADELISLLTSSPKDFAAKAAAKGVTTAQLKNAVQALWYSAEGVEAPENIKTALTMAEQAQKLEAQRKDFEEYKAKQEADIKNQAAQAQVNTARNQYQASIDSYLSTSFDDAPLVRVYAEENRAAIVKQLFTLGLAHAEANPDEPVPSAPELVKQLEAALSDEFAPLKKRGFLIDPKANTPSVQEATAPSALTNQRAATASKQRAAALTAEERHAEAMKALEAAGRRNA